ncbi:MAG: hypothetical protein RLZZ282_59 [Verrucomicrobiota bacterium]
MKVFVRLRQHFPGICGIQFEALDDVGGRNRHVGQHRRGRCKTTVGLETPPDLPLVRGDRIHLQQVLLNRHLNGMGALGRNTDHRPQA